MGHDSRFAPGVLWCWRRPAGGFTARGTPQGHAARGREPGYRRYTRAHGSRFAPGVAWCLGRAQDSAWVGFVVENTTPGARA
jgi:hypothetical protein